MTVKECDRGGDGWQLTFPFVERFEDVVDHVVSVEYVEQMACVLEPAVHVYAEVVQSPEVSEVSVRALLFTVCALARCKAVLAYREEIGDDAVDKSSLLSAVCYEWQRMVERDSIVCIGYTPVVGAVLGPCVTMVWAHFALQRLYTARELCHRYPSFVATVLVVPVAQVLVVSERGLPLSEQLVLHPDKPVLPACAYRSLLQRLKGVDVVTHVVGAPDELLKDRDAPLDTGFGVLQSAEVRSWLWLLLASFGEMRGYCYQLLYPPAQRFAVCSVLRQCPLVADLLWHLEGTDCGWLDKFAVVDYCGDLHVSGAGKADLVKLREFATRRIGMMRSPSALVDVDYYARALVDEFIEKHKPLPSVPVNPPPLDAEFEALSVSSDSTVGREFVDVANMLYSAVDEVVSPRAEDGGAAHAFFNGVDDRAVERDSEVVQEVYNRLSDGAVIHESYFQKTYRRFQKMRRRPRLEQSDGRLYHVFEGFPADGGVGVGPWQLDKNWGIPGWRSYTAVFDAGEVRNVSFSVEDGCQDVRMDCSGEGAIELGDCKVKVFGTLLWFTNSIRLKLTAKTDVCLRISVPEALSAVAIGADMRRYMHIPGYTVVARSFDVVTGGVDLNIPVERTKRNSVAGCHVYTGQKYVERGRHRFKLSQVVSTAPARLLLKTEPPEALLFVSVCGMRLHPRTRDHVSVLVDLRNVEMYVSTSVGSTLTVSMAQVVRVREFELAVASNVEARRVRMMASA